MCSNKCYIISSCLVNYSNLCHILDCCALTDIDSDKFDAVFSISDNNSVLLHTLGCIRFFFIADLQFHYYIDEILDAYAGNIMISFVESVHCCVGVVVLDTG